MRLQVKAVHDHVNDSVKEYVDKRLAKIGRRLYEGTAVEVTLGKERNPSIADDHWAEAIVYTKGPSIVAREAATTYEAAIDRLLDKLERQVERQRDMKTHERRRRSPREQAVPAEELESTVEAGSEESAA